MRHLGAELPRGRTLAENQWRARQRALRWLLWAHVVAIPVISLLYDQGIAEAALDATTVGILAVIAQLKLGGRRAQSLVVTLGLLSSAALLVHVSDSYFYFFVVVAGLVLYEDWLPFLVAVVFVLAVEFDSPWLWVFIGALSLVLLLTWRASERDREAFRSLVESLEEGVLMVDGRGKLVAANPSARRILGMPPERVLGPNGSDADWEFLDEDGSPLPEEERPLRITGQTGRPLAGRRLGLRRPDGSIAWLSVSTRAVEPDREGPYTVVLSFSDITEERNALEALARSNAELAQFAYVASHDLSEPLRMVSSYLNLLRRRYHGRLDADADEFIDYAVDGAARMRGLIEALLAYSRAGSGERREIVDLGSVTADVLRSLAAALVEAGAEIEIGELPAVLGDRSQLEQLLQNLMSNALKFRAGGRARLWVYAESDDGEMARIAVADGGIGIAPEQREQVFEMFNRLHDRESYEGTGIGLAICRKIVERHGGRIWIDEREGGGAVFRFTLPVA